MVPVTRATHAGQLWRRLVSYRFAAKESFVPIGGVELGRAAAAMPTAFWGSSGEFVPVALLSLTSGVNLFVAPDGRWLGAYVPLLLRCYPFRLLPVQGSDRFSLCVDAEADGSTDASASTEVFYDPEGNLGPATKAVLDTLLHLEQNRLLTSRAIAALVEAKVVCPWTIKIQDGDKEKMMSGLYRIDEKALAGLSDEAFLRIRKVGAIPVAYAQLLSMAQLDTLTQLAALWRRLQESSVVAPTGPAQTDAGDAFRIVDTATLRFD